MKKIIAMIGSLRKDSVNRQVFHYYQRLAKDELNIVEGEIKDIPLYSQDYQSEPATVTALSKQIKDADGILFFSPEYNYSIPGVLKNALDWVSRNESQPFLNKPSSVIGASPGQLGAARMQYHLRQVGVFLNLHFMNKPEVMINAAYEKIKNGEVLDEGTISVLRSHVASFTQFIHQSCHGK